MAVQLIFVGYKMVITINHTTSAKYNSNYFTVYSSSI